MHSQQHLYCKASVKNLSHEEALAEADRVQSDLDALCFPDHEPDELKKDREELDSYLIYLMYKMCDLMGISPPPAPHGTHGAKEHAEFMRNEYGVPAPPDENDRDA